MGFHRCQYAGGLSTNTGAAAVLQHALPYACVAIRLSNRLLLQLMVLQRICMGHWMVAGMIPVCCARAISLETWRLARRHLLELSMLYMVTGRILLGPALIRNYGGDNLLPEQRVFNQQRNLCCVPVEWAFANGL